MMKKVLLLSTMFVCCLIWNVDAVAPHYQKDIDYKGIPHLTVQQFLDLSPKEIKEKTGQKMKLRDRIVLKIAQHNIKKKVKKGEKVDFENMYKRADRSFNLGGFLLGFFFSLLGVLIAILFGRDAVRSAWKGFLVGLLVAIIGWLLF